MHWTFYPVAANKDFNGDWDAAHQYGDTGIDLLVNIDKNRWTSNPTTWWIPIKDLENVYRRMGKAYSTNEIRWGTAVISIAGLGERAIAAPAYPYLQWKMPWTASNYYNWSEGGILMDEYKVVEYQMNLWARLQSKTKTSVKPSLAAQSKHSNGHQTPSSILTFAEEAIKSGAVDVSVTHHADGSIEFGQPIIKREAEFQTLLNQLLAKLTK